MTSLLLTACALLACALVHLDVRAQEASERAAIARLVRGMFAALQSRGAEAALGFWEKQPPPYEGFRKMAETLAAAGNRYEDFTFNRWEVGGERARVRVHFKIAKRSAGGESRRLIVWNMTLVKRDGAWRLWNHVDTIAAFAEELLRNAPTKEERKMLFDISPDLISAELAQTINEWAEAELKRGNYEEALRVSGVAEEVALRHDDKRALAQTYEERGLIFHGQRDYERMLPNTRRAAALYREARDERGEVRTLNAVSNILLETGRYEEALAAIAESAALARPLPDKTGLIGALMNRGEVYREMGWYADALASFDECLALTADPSFKSQRDEALNNLGVVYRLLGRYEEALAKFKDSLSLKRAIRDRPGEALVLDNIGIVYSAAGDYERALASLDESLKIKRTLGGPRDAAGVGPALINLGVTYIAAGKYKKALGALEEALGIATAAGDRHREAVAQKNIGDVLLATRRYAEALDRQGRSLALASALDRPDLSAAVYASIGSTHRLQGRMAQAAEAYRNSIERVELLRERTEVAELQISLLQQYVIAYHGLAESLLTLGSKRQEEAFAVSERAKARTLAEILVAGGVTPMKGLSDSEREQERQLRRDAAGAAALLDAALSAPGADAARVALLRAELRRARTSFEEFRGRMYIAHRALQTQRAQFEPAGLVRLNQTLFANEPRLCLFSYLVGNEKVFLFVLTKGSGPDAPAALNVYTLKGQDGEDLTRERLSALLSTFRQRYSNEDGMYKRLGAELYRLLVAPAERELAGKSHLVVVPDGILNTLPFQILVDGEGKHMIEGRSISYAPSVTSLVEMIRLADARRWAAPGVTPVFALGRGTFPDQAEYRERRLPWAVEQAEAIAALFRAKAVTEAEATKGRALAGMGGARFAHLATHGEVNNASPMYSAVMLGKGDEDDGRLYARDIADMNLKAEMVVLSACETGLGRQANGEGLLGLTWSLFVAGTPTSVVSQWSVPALSTKELMLKFYEPLARAGGGAAPGGKAEALRGAQLALLRSGQYSHAYHWGAFALMGDWR